MAHEDTSITLVRSFDVPIARMFSAWVDPHLMRAWLSPRSCLIRDIEAQARAGGLYRISLTDARGDHRVTRGEYIEVVPNTRIAKTWMTERPGAALRDDPTKLVVEFRKTPAGAGTEITRRHEGIAPGVPQARVRQRWTECLDRLEEMFDGTGNGNSH